ncbi:MAG: aldehyde dehydrogenase family protein [Pseudomonadota bacterium]
MTIERTWYPTDKCFINGDWVDPANAATLPIENPSTGETIGSIARGSEEDIHQAVLAARGAYEGEWGHTSAVERGRLLTAIGNMVLEHADDLAFLEACDVGKPLSQARADVKALARYMEFYAGAADKMHGETIPFMDGYTVYTLREPHGVTGHIVPWNYPMQILGRNIGAALAMGNACVLKPAEDASLTALAIAEIAKEVDVPSGVINVVPGLGNEAGAALTSHPDINHISFTGSVPTGEMVQAAASKNVVPVVLELGGKSPQLVFDDVDLDKALPFLVGPGIQNAGQTCSAASRILIQKGVYGTVCEAMAERYSNLKVGPAIEDHDVGPLISAKQKRIVDGMMNQAPHAPIAEGNIVESAPSSGHYVSPKLFADMPPDHLLSQNEIFGPVQCLIPFEDEEEAIAIANGTQFGLVSSIWTENGARQMRLARKLRSGQVFVNNYGAGGGVELPFGGMGKSGHGREKGFEALYGMSTLKTVAVKHD